MNHTQKLQDDPNYVPIGLHPKESKNQNPKIGRPAKTNQQEQFKNYYLINRQKFQLECELLVYIHQQYFDEMAQNPINQRVSPIKMTHLFSDLKCMRVYNTLLRLNQAYFKNSSYYPQQKLQYTSVIDVAYMLKKYKDQHGENINCSELLLIIFFFLYNEKLVNEEFYQYFKNNFIKFKEGMIFGPSGKSSKLDKMDKLIICLALELAIRQNVMIQQEIQYSDQSDQDQQDANSGSGGKRSHSHLQN